jgi:choice-of-anchor A domain-containing protein
VIFGDYHETTSDTEGRLAVGGNAKLFGGYNKGGYSIADKTGLAPGSCNVNVGVFRGDLTWPMGQAYFGSLAVGGKANVGPTIMLPACKAIKKYTVDMMDFNASQTELSALSQRLAGMASTVAPGGQSIKTTSLTLTFTPNNAINVVNINQADFFMWKQGQAVGVTKFEAINGAAPNSIIVINVRGAQTGMTNINTELLKGFQVIFNFPDATCIKFHGLTLHGHVLAVNADATGIKDAQGNDSVNGIAQGELKGQVFLKSLCGPIQLSLKPLTCGSSESKDDCTKAATEVKCRLRPASY